MRAAAAVGLCLLMLACTYTPPLKPKARTDADREHDTALIASILQAADSSGAAFRMAGLLQETGGSIAQGQARTIQSSGSGTLKAGRDRMTVSIVKPKATYAMVYADGQIYARSGAGPWRSTTAAALNPLYLAVRLTLIRESVLLARSVSAPATETIPEGSAHHYKVVPSGDQLEQILAITVNGAAEQAFLQSASGTLDVYLAASGNQLLRLQVTATGVDPASGVKDRVQSLAAFKVGGKIAAIDLPAGSTAVLPNQILGTQ